MRLDAKFVKEYRYTEDKPGERRAYFERLLAMTLPYAANNYRLVDRNLDPRLLRAMTRRYLIGEVHVVASLTLIVSLTLLFILPEPGERRQPDSRTSVTGDAGSQEDQCIERSGRD